MKQLNLHLATSNQIFINQINLDKHAVLVRDKTERYIVSYSAVVEKYRLTNLKTGYSHAIQDDNLEELLNKVSQKFSIDVLKY